MSAQELESLVTMLRSGGPDLATPPPQARENFEAMFAGFPIAADIAFEPTTLGGVPARWSNTPGAPKERVLFYLHGGAYVLGSSLAYRSLFGELARAAGARGLALDYRLAPESPFPGPWTTRCPRIAHCSSQGIAPDSIAIAGDSAGGGLTVAMLVAARDAGLPMPAAAVAISPWADLECTGGSMINQGRRRPLTESRRIGCPGFDLSQRGIASRPAGFATVRQSDRAAPAADPSGICGSSAG